MKKLAFLLVFAFALSGMILVHAEEESTVYTCGDFEYVLLEDGSAEIVYYTGTMEALTIPEQLDGYVVTSIGDEAFCYCDFLTEISIPESVTRIGDYAFFGCASLTEITIPNSVVAVGINPFACCEKLTGFSVSPGHPTLTTIGGVLVDNTEQKLICYIHSPIYKRF